MWISFFGFAAAIAIGLGVAAVLIQNYGEELRPYL